MKSGLLSGTTGPGELKEMLASLLARAMAVPKMWYGRGSIIESSLMLVCCVNSRAKCKPQI